MTDWAAKRFWTDTAVAQVEGGFGVTLDGRMLRTPVKSALVLPTRGMADEVAREWDAQEGKIDPLSMPFTRAANAATDKVTPQHAEVADMLAAYGDSDLICYRASDPRSLVERQNKGWDPLVDWSATALKAPLQVYVGVMHAEQPVQSVATLRQKVHSFDAFRLAAFHDLVSLSGSLIIGMAVTENYASAIDLWDISRIDENWQAEQWGHDEEAEQMAIQKRDAFLHADRFFRLCA